MASPASLVENADRTLAREATRKGVDPDSEAARDLAVRKIVRHYGRLAGATAGGTAMTGIIPGVGTAAALTLGIGTDMVVTLKLQAEMAMQIAHLYGSDISSEEQKHLAFLLASLGATANAGQEAISKGASKALTRLLERHLRGATLASVKQGFRAFGLVFTRKAVAKAIPFGVGVAVGYSTGQLLTKKVGREVSAHYRVSRPANGADIIDIEDAVFDDVNEATQEEE